MSKNNYIFIRYNANPDWPDISCHLASLQTLTQTRTKKFELDKYEEAWKFIMECKSPITKLAQILWAFPRKKALDMFQAIDELKESIPEFVYEELNNDQVSDDEIEETLFNLKINEKSYRELITLGIWK